MTVRLQLVSLRSRTLEVEVEVEVEVDVDDTCGALKQTLVAY